MRYSARQASGSPRRGYKSAADRDLGRSVRLVDAEPPMLDRYASATLVNSPQGRPVDVHVFPGRTSRRALVIGGVHGTEFVGVEVTRRLINALLAEQRRNTRPFFTTVIVPALFPDNLPSSHGGEGPGRRATRGRADPNRQFPTIGTGVDTDLGEGLGAPRDALGRSIERANLALIDLIRRTRPRRIASVHAIGRARWVGIYADPDPGTGTPVGEEAGDLAERMHVIACACGARLPGSARRSCRYPLQDEVARHGISLGAWASQAVKTGAQRRSAVPVITLELKRDWVFGGTRRRQRQVDAFVRAIRRGFLEP